MTSKIKVDEIEESTGSAGVTLKSNTVIDTGKTLTITDGLATSAITSGTIADARISESSITQHTVVTDITPLQHDILTLALHSAVADNKAAHNLSSAFIDQFEDDTGIGTETDIQRNASEYVISAQETFVHQSSANGFTEANIRWIKSDTTNGSTTVTDSSSTGASLSRGSVAHSTTQNKLGTSSLYFNNYSSAISSSGTNTNINSQSNYTISYWIYLVSVGTLMTYGSYNSNAVWSIGLNSARQPGISTGDGWLWSNNHTANFATPLNEWTHHQWVKTGGNLYFYQNGVLDSTLNGSTFTNGRTTNYTHYIGSYFNSSAGFQGYLDEIRMMTSAETPTLSNFGGKYALTSATGTLISVANVPATAKTKVTGVLLYKDAAGTATLGTDLKIYFTCNGGSNWTEAASYTAVTPTFSTGIKMVKLGETTCTSGSDIRYKAVWANQSAGSKETQVHGMAIDW